jgi:ubiquinone/menaquinone biosynthesis C-methylase UbiE
MPDENSQFAKSEVGGVFDRVADYYADERGASPWFQAQLKIVLDMLGTEKGLLLDIGCAAGAEFAPLAARGFQIVGLDYSSEMLRLAHNRFRTSVNLCRGDAESLPFPDASFDHVICLGVFEYLSTYEKCLDEIHRILRPGGLAVISLPTRISLDRLSYNLIHATAVPLWRAVKRLRGKRTSNHAAARRWNRCDPLELDALVAKHGFHREDGAYSGFLLFPLGQVWPRAEYRLFSLMERFSRSQILGWMLSQYLICARKEKRG